ncbi:MAG: hypothetical protein ABID09_02390 [Candidatus Omnitrophota bacterium]
MNTGELERAIKILRGKRDRSQDDQEKKAYEIALKLLIEKKCSSDTCKF